MSTLIIIAIFLAISILGLTAYLVYLYTKDTRNIRALKVGARRMMGWRRRKIAKLKKAAKKAKKKIGFTIFVTIFAVVAGIIFAISALTGSVMSHVLSAIGSYGVYVLYALILIATGFLLKWLWGKFSGEKIDLKWLSSAPLLAAVGVLFAMFILYAVDPVLWNRWLGGERGLYYGLAAVIGIPLAILLKKKEVNEWVWIGLIVLALSPLIKETAPGQKVVGMYEKVVAGDQDIDQDTYRQRLLERGGIVKSMPIDTRGWLIGIYGEKGCHGARYTRGILDGSPNFLVRCHGGATPLPHYWPAEWGKMPNAGDSVQHPVVFPDSVKIEMVNLGDEPLKVFAKVK